MAKLRLTLACGDYDLTRPLVDGRVQPEGIELISLTMPSPERHWRMIRNREFDVCEFSMCQYLVSKAKGEPLVAIPVFPHRRFRHSYIFVNAKAGIRKPKDLEGKKVGLRSSQNTAGLWLRGMLQHYYNVSLKKITWVTQDEEPVQTKTKAGLKVERVAPGGDIDSMLVRGELAAAIYPDILPSFSRGDKAVRRLFDDPVAEEKRFFKDTGFFPIMHTVVMKQDLVETYPWIAKNLQVAFHQSKDICFHRMEDPRKVSLAWFMHHWEEQKQILGPDPWVYGLKENQKSLESMVAYAHEQGLIPRKFKLGELFIEHAAEKSPHYLIDLKKLK
ncbi:MAG: ABC transporter substrate-binding protein [Desulfobacterales bacterium]|nr:ABC transporter substrate-binding protein [Desulfobacterales bacterium]